MAVDGPSRSNGAPRTSRIIKSAEFGAVLSSPRQSQIRAYTSRFALTAAQNALGRFRLGLTVGKKNAPLSVERNLVKRILRENFRVRSRVFAKEFSSNNPRYGLDVCIRLKAPLKGGVDAGPSALKKNLHSEAAELFAAFSSKLKKAGEKA